jgi:hypothetical protein
LGESAQRDTVVKLKLMLEMAQCTIAPGQDITMNRRRRAFGPCKLIVQVRATLWYLSIWMTLAHELAFFWYRFRLGSLGGKRRESEAPKSAQRENS